MTTKNAILALAAKVGNAAVDNCETETQALATLAYAMTGKTPTKPIATTEDAFAFITANYVDDTPTGTISITANGENINVTQYAYANVSVSGGGIDAELFVPSAAASGTYTVDGVAVEFEDVSEGGWTGKHATLPAGTVVTYTPAGEAPATLIYAIWPSLEMLYDDDSNIVGGQVYPYDDAFSFPVAGILTCYEEA